MAERRFARGLSKPGMAALLRENVSQAVKATALQQARSRLVEPMDFEDYVEKNKILLNNDTVRELLFVPPDVVQFSIIPRELHTLHCLASVIQSGDVRSSLVRQCLHTYCTPYSEVSYKEGSYSGSYLQLQRLPKLEDLKEQVYEIDTDIEQGDMTILSSGENIIKKGYLLKGPDGSNEKLFSNFSSKTFKRRYACLRQEVDGTFLLEFHKDERKHDPKGTIVLDFCTAVNKNPVRGACWFELHFSSAAGGGVSVLSAESETDMQDWTDKLNRVIHADKPMDAAGDRIRDKVSTNGENGTSAPYGGTLRTLQRSLGPQLARLLRETPYSRQQARVGARTNLFNCCPDLKRTEDLCPPVESPDEGPAGPVASSKGIRIRVFCEHLRFRLQAPIDAALDGPLSQLEPYMTSLALYDVSSGCKVSEDFHFDLNSPMARSLLSTGSYSRSRLDSTASSSSPPPDTDSCDVSPVPLPLCLAGVPEEWVAYPKQCVCSVVQPSPNLFLVVLVHKVLQGGVSSAVEPYLKQSQDSKSLSKLQKSIRTCCSRLGNYRMPFAWSARQLFTADGKLDPNTDFCPLYKLEEKKTSEAEIVRLLGELKKADKLSKFTVIPGSLCLKLGLTEVTTPNTLTPALEPVIPFPNPPTHEPTMEVQEFHVSNNLNDLDPYTSYVNHLYVYPRHLNYDNQKIFGRARNIVCSVELRDSDCEGSRPLRVVYSRPCRSNHLPGATLTTSANTVVLHHNTFPEWADEIKLALPHNLTPSHHLLFTFSHIAIEGSKAGKREDPVEVVGYAWLLLLQKGRLISEEQQILPVAAHLPAKYLAIEPFGLGKGFAGPEVRWVDSQKNVFRVNTVLVSSVLTSDQHLHNFFQSTCQLLTPPQTPAPTPIGSTANPFATAFTNAMTSGSHTATSVSSAALENGTVDSNGIAGAYRKRTDSGSTVSNDSGSKGAYEASVSVSSAVPRTNGALPNAETLSAIAAISPAITTPKSSRSSSVSTLVGSASVKTGPSEAETVRNIKAVLGISSVTLIRFLPSLLNRLLAVLVAGGLEVRCSALSALVDLFSRLDACGRVDLVQRYVKYQVSVERPLPAVPVSSSTSVSSASPGTTAHESLCQALSTLLRPPVTDQPMCEAALQQSPHILGLLVRCMATYLVSSARIKMDRRERFGPAFNTWVRGVVESLAHHITQNSKMLYARTANTALAHFIKRLLHMMDRGFVFSLVKVYLEAFSPGDRIGLQILKLAFLRTVCSHAHYVQLNLPCFDTRLSGKEAKLALAPEEYRLSPAFVSRHYLVGVLLGTVAGCLGEVGEVQRAGVSLLRDLLTKHAADDRYSQENQQGRIACLYLPIIGLLLENVERLLWPSVKSTGPAVPSVNRASAPPTQSSISSSNMTETRGSTRAKPSRVTYANSVDSGSVCLTPSRGTSPRSPEAVTPRATPIPSTSPLLTPQSSITTPHHHSLYAQNSVCSQGSSQLSYGPSSQVSLSGRCEASYLSLIAGPGGFMAGNPSSVGELFARGAAGSDMGRALMLLSPGRSSTSLESEDPPPSVVASETTLEEDSEDKEDCESSVKAHSRQLSISFAGEHSVGDGGGEIVRRYDKLRPTQDLLLCGLQVLRHVPAQHLVAYWTTLSTPVLLDFLTILHLCLEHFRYHGKRAVVRCQQQQQQFATIAGPSGHLRTRKASTLPTKLQPPYASGGLYPGNTDTYPGASSSVGSGFAWQRSLQEANLATQVGLIVLDTLGTLISQCSERLLEPCNTALINKAVGLHLIMLQLGQSETLLKHIFAALRGVIQGFPTVLFQGDASLCGWLCFELLKCCNSKLSSVRQEASVVLYLLMRANYLHTSHAGINRVHLQVIISVSQLLGEVMGLNNSRFQESMALVNSYAQSDASVNDTGLVAEVRDLTTRVRTVLVATAQMAQHSNDPEMLCSLQHSLAASYAATPQLRITWLHAMARLHLQHSNLSEAAMCEIHIGAVMAEYLRGEGVYSQGCRAFGILSPNIMRDETNNRTDQQADALANEWLGGQSDTVFTMDSLVSQLECCALMLDNAERYEQLGNLYRLLIPIYEQRRNYPALVHCYSHLLRAYTHVVEVNESQKRLLGTYFRVVFYGIVFFEDESGKEYVYKEPKITSLAEVSERLYHQYCEKFGKENVKMIMDSNFVEPEDLDSRYAYIQVTHVVPYFPEKELPNRQTEYERNNNITQFVFETPFTRPNGTEEDKSETSSDSGDRKALRTKPRAHGRLQDQWKRRVIISTDYCFPYVLKRIPIVNSEVLEMSPIEVAIDEMEGRIKELAEIINKKPPDIKKLQLKLQGSISVQVNAGPLAYATTFLQDLPATSPSSDNIARVSTCNSTANYPSNQIAKLRELYRQFMVTCKLALDLNAQLISSDQSEYQLALESTYSELLSALEAVLGFRIVAEVAQSTNMDPAVNLSIANRSSQVSNYSGAYLSLFGSNAAADC